MFTKTGTTKTITDIDGVEWWVFQSRPTIHGFDIKVGIAKDNAHGKRLSMILTENVARYVCGLVNLKEAELPVCPYTIYKWRKRCRARFPGLKPNMEVVKDVFGRQWYVVSSKRTKQGFSINLGEPVNDRYNKGKKYLILTEEIARYLFGLKDIREADLPVSRSQLLLWSRQYEAHHALLNPEIVTDIRGRRYLVRKTQPTKHGFDVKRGSSLDEGVRASRSIILTEELAQYLRQCPDMTQADLPISFATLCGWRHKFDIGQTPGKSHKPKAKKTNMPKSRRLIPPETLSDEWWEQHRVELSAMSPEKFSFIFDVSIEEVESRRKMLK
ncbi:MAG: hypothetical protein LBG61_06620 [Burkholderiales bacterium]|jgi:hypothetical protein|nr:hypothetical protein [Burkholderiales bacterium]